MACCASGANADDARLAATRKLASSGSMHVDTEMEAYLAEQLQQCAARAKGAQRKVATQPDGGRTAGGDRTR